MQTITLKNADGEIIQVRKTPAGQVEICHSDIEPNTWGEFIDATLAWQGKEALGKVKINGQTHLLNGAEVALIRAAVKQLG
jgi:hypothetical protein